MSRRCERRLVPFLRLLAQFINAYGVFRKEQSIAIFNDPFPLVFELPESILWHAGRYRGGWDSCQVILPPNYLLSMATREYKVGGAAGAEVGAVAIFEPWDTFLKSSILLPFLFIVFSTKYKASPKSREEILVAIIIWT